MSHDLLKALAMGVTLIVLGMAITMAVWTKDTVPKVGYTVGQCLAYNGDYEPWEQAQVWYIEMVGKRSYLVRKYPASLYKEQAGTTIDFGTAVSWYRRVECPTMK